MIESLVETTEAMLNALAEMYGIAVRASRRNLLNRMLPDDLKRWEWILTTRRDESITLVLELTQLSNTAALPTFCYTHGPLQLAAVGGHVFAAAKEKENEMIRMHMVRSAEVISQCFHDTPKRHLLRRQNAGSFRQR